MFKNYVTVALRNLIKHKLFTLINIAGLVIGLMALILSNSLVNHEQNYDNFFPNHDRIYAVAGVTNPTKGEAVRFAIGVPAPVQPLIEANVPGVEYSARLWQSERVAKVGDRRFYQNMRFADPDFLKIFALDFLAGDSDSAMATRDGLIITRSAAHRYFGNDDALGRSITIDNRLDLRVTGIIEDLPKNSHLTNIIIGSIPFEFIARIEIFEELTGFRLDDRWGSTGSQDVVYAMLENGASVEAVNAGLTRLYQTFVPEENDFQVDYFLLPLNQLNSWVWDSIGIPVPQSVRILGLLILLVAIFNYSNLANAQYMGRIREIGLRKSLGANRRQLLVQFLAESVTVTVIALVIALWLSILLLGPLNDVTGKNFSLSGLFTPPGLAMLLGIAVVTGVLGSLHPALRISRTPVIACLSDRGLATGRGKLRNFVVALQFGIAIMLASAAAVIYAQNRHVEAQSTLFDRDHIVLLDRIGRKGVIENYPTLKTELERLAGVKHVTASNNVPYEMSSDSSSYAPIHGDKASAAELLMIYTDHDFMKTYDVPIVAGRDFDRSVALDTYPAEEASERGSVNVILNTMAARQLGWENPDQALQGRFYYSDPDSPSIEHRAIGIIDDFNYQGAFSRVRPMMFLVRPELVDTAAILVDGQGIGDTVTRIDDAWNRLNPEFPLARQFLDDQFEQFFNVLRALAGILGGFALVAVFVAFIGLFGLSAFVTRSRTKEIGLRKVLGATVARLMQLMIVQISVPVLIAMIPAAMLAWAGMNYGYLQVFSDRIGSVAPFVAVAAVAVLLIAWAVVSINALRVASASPIHALRYE